jgi:hypothetical protein
VLNTRKPTLAFAEIDELTIKLSYPIVPSGNVKLLLPLALLLFLFRGFRLRELTLGMVG